MNVGSWKNINSKKRADRTFNVLIAGSYARGRRTLTNCLVGKQIFSSVIPTTFPTEIFPGPDDGMVKVHWKDPTKPEYVIPWDLLNGLLNTEKEYIYEGDISYLSVTAEMEESRICYVTQYFKYNYSDNREMLEGMDAVIVVLSARYLLLDEEREFIKAHFVKRGLKNVFFAVNWCNILRAEEEQQCYDVTKEVLADVFTNEDGYFDEELYRRRVFFVDAYTSMCARTGQCKEERIGVKFISVLVSPEDDEHTGVPDLERAVKRYLGLY